MFNILCFYAHAFAGNVMDTLVAYSHSVVPWLVPLFALDIHQDIIYDELYSSSGYGVLLCINQPRFMYTEGYCKLHDCSFLLNLLRSDNTQLTLAYYMKTLAFLNA